MVKTLNGDVIFYTEWDEIPEKYKSFLKKELDNPDSQIHTRYGVIWNQDPVIVGAELTKLFTSTSRMRPVHVYDPELFGAERGYKEKTYKFGREFGCGKGFKQYPEETAPPLPFRIYVGYEAGSTRLKNYLTGFHEFPECEVLMIGQDVYDILKTVDPDIPEDRFYPVIVNSLNKTDVGQMYLYDPVVKTDIVDPDKSIIRWSYIEKFRTGGSRFIASFDVPSFRDDQSYSIVNIKSNTNKFYIDKDLAYTFLKKKTRGIERSSDVTDNYLERQYQPKLLIG